MTRIPTRTVAIPLLGVVLTAGVACGPPRPNAALEQARAAYREANQEPSVTENAPVALHEASQALQRAERGWQDDDDDETVTHLAYLAQNRIELARAVAREKGADQEAERLAREREQAVVGARTGEAARARAHASRLEQELAALQARETERGLEVTLSDVNFDFNRAELRPRAEKDLRRLVDYLKASPARQILIEGHADAAGSSTYNMDLSRARADAVKSYLVRDGIDPDRITTTGYGETYPVASNETESGRQQNRRAEIIVLRAGEVASHHLRSAPGAASGARTP
jgi:outer membrane protein OmpA-like peptidoglycan-associated protein